MKKLFIILLFIFTTFPALSSEQINTFHADINIQLDGSVIITETLNIRHEGHKIKRGIVRTLPTNSGEKYQLISVKRNGVTEPSFVKRTYGHYHINTGNESFLPRPMESTFEIKYQVWNVLRKYDTHDELYWNVTGDDWDFPILKASARVYLPNGVQLTKKTGFVGRYQSKENSVYQENNSWSSPRTLSPGEQLTIAAGFTPDIVDIASSSPTQIKQQVTLLYIVFLIYCFTVWWFKGRDPASHAIMPLYEAPKGISAASSYLLMNKGKWTATGTAAALAQMVTSGFLTMKHEQKKSAYSTKHIFSFYRTQKEPSNEEERRYPLTMGTRNLTITSDEYNRDLNSLDLDFQDLAIQKTRSMYTRNNKWIWPAWGILLVAFLIFHSSTMGSLMPLFVFGVFLFFIPLRISQITGWSFKKSFTIFAVLGLVFVLAAISVERALSYVPAILLLSVVTAVIFQYLMYRPSPFGQHIIEQLKGLKMFLSATHISPTAPTLTIEQMEELFPYALALGVEDKWEDKFKSIFGSALATQVSKNIHLSTHFGRHLKHDITHSLSLAHFGGRGRSGFKGFSGFGGGGFGGGGFSGGGFGGGGGGGR